MSDFRITTNHANLEAVLTSASRKILVRRSVSVLQSARASAGPAMKDTLGYTLEGATHRDFVAKIGSNDPEARFEEGGTPPHIIRPKNAKVLKFPGTKSFSGRTVFTALVRHPGTAGKHTLRNALRKVIGNNSV